MWQIFIFIEQTYFNIKQIFFYQENALNVTEQILLYGALKFHQKNHGLKISWDEFFMVQNFMGSKSWD